MRNRNLIEKKGENENLLGSRKFRTFVILNNFKKWFWFKFRNNNYSGSLSLDFSKEINFLKKNK